MYRKKHRWIKPSKDSENSSSAPKQALEIGISIPTGWFLNISPDGSGTFGFGDGAPNHYAKFAPATFDVSKVIDDISKDLSVRSDTHTTFRIVIAARGSSDRTAKYFGKKEIIKTLFDRAHSNISLSLDRTTLDALWNSQPPA